MTSASPSPATDDPIARLSVVVPVFNEESWIGICLDALRRSAEHAEVLLDVVVVDDGSTDGTAEVLRERESQGELRVVSQANAGRLSARLAGLRAAREETVLLLDSRVIIEDPSLAWLRSAARAEPARRVWVGHVDVDARGNPYAAFWAGLVKIGWRRYTADPRLVSFGPEEFDQYPKGTGCLVAPRQLLLDAMSRFGSLFDDESLASDDTRMLRDVAEHERMWLSPDFAFRYHGRRGMRGFVRQSYFRGTTFVDGYLARPGVIRWALFGGLAAVGAGVVVLVRHPRTGVVGIVAAAATGAAGVRAVGGSAAESGATAALAPVFVPAFTAGVVRGLLLAAQARTRRHRSS